MTERGDGEPMPAAGGGADGEPGQRSRRRRRRVSALADLVSWTPPTSTEIGVVTKSALAAGVAWWIARLVTDVDVPLLASLTAIVVVQVSVRASVLTAFQRSGAVVLGVLFALAIGDALTLNGLTIALLVAISLGVTQLLLRLPPAAARQAPISILVVLTTVSSHESSAGERAVSTVLGALIGIIVSFALPSSRLVDARQTLERLAASLSGVLDSMAAGLHASWTTTQTDDWRRTARTARVRLATQATEAVGSSREAARWNLRDRRHVVELARYELALPRLERTTIGVSVIARGLDDHARVDGTTHDAMAAMGDLFGLLAEAVRAVMRDLLGQGGDHADDDVRTALEAVRRQRDQCLLGAARRAQIALEPPDDGGALPGDSSSQAEWLGYTALLVQVDRIVADLGAPLTP